MAMITKNESVPMPPETLLFILTGMHGQPAIDMLLSTMTNGQLIGKE